jgi:formate hydrogenlyase subunit 3/multisubunit Na+/H+ antiporter MnhD subunit
MSILLPIEISLIAGLFFLCLPDKLRGFTRIISPIIGILCFALSVMVFFNGTVPDYISQYILGDLLSRFIYLGIGFFGFIVSVYAAGYARKPDIENQLPDTEIKAFFIQDINKFFAYFFLTLGSALAITVTDNLLILLGFWGFLGMTLYLLIQLGNREGSTDSDSSEETANQAAKKTLIIIGASDCFLILGVGILWHLSNSFKMSTVSFLTTSPLLTFSFLCFVIAAFTKAGNMPFHTWIPSCAHTAPIPVTAYLPASLDKLLGIYLLSRCVLSMYRMSQGLSTFLMIAGALTILFAVFMALVQHSGRKLLAYHAISQVGYMVLGIGTGNPIGICGGLFHMINNTVYKSCLFLGLGNVERRTGTDDLDRLGGLAKKMPLTMFTMLTASLAISGIPPLNGFFSKWLIYQGVVSTFSVRNPFVPALCLIAALFGSALTLASFAKLLHAIFLTRSDDTGPRQGGESPLLMVPQLILAIACIVLGIFAGPIIIKPVLAKISGFHPIGVWQPELAFTLMIAGVVLGLLIYGISRVKVRTVKGFIGGEEITPDMKVSGTGFYLTIEQIPLFGKIYGQARRGFFDLYEILKAWVFFFAKAFKFVHCGSLPFYLLWLIGGLTVILLIR